MNWKYEFPGTQAIHVDTGTRFTVDFKCDTPESVRDFDIRPDPSGGKIFSPKDIELLKEDLWKRMADQQQQRRRRKLESLIGNHLLGDNHRAATILSRTTGRKVSERSIQAWLIDPTKRSSRNCPHWAIKAIEQYLEDPENRADLDETKKYYVENPKRYSPSSEMWDKYAVGAATTEIEADERRSAKWNSGSFTSIPGMICEFESRTEKNLRYLNKANGIFWNALRDCNSFDDFKDKVLRGHAEIDSLDCIPALFRQ